MSLDIYLTCEHCESHLGEFSYNITHNLNQVADAVGLYQALWRPEEIQVSRAEELVPYLVKGLQDLHKRKKELKRLEPENGWGSVENLIDFCTNLLKDCLANPNARLKVSR